MMSDSVDSVPPPRRADAVLIEKPAALKVGSSLYGRIDSVLNVVEPLLGLDRSRGGTGWIRNQPGGRAFITGDPADTINHPRGSGRTGCRYNWSPHPHDPNIVLGYLKDAPSDGGGSVAVAPESIDGTGEVGGLNA